MNQPFTIQCGHPTIREVKPREFKTLADLFPYLFSENEESAYLFWFGTPIRLHYTYELYQNINEISGLCWLLQKEDSGELTASFMLEQLIMDWHITWSNGNVQIKSEFTSRMHSYDVYAQFLNKKQELTMPLEDFLAEWKTLLMQLSKAIKASRMTIEDGIERRRYEVMLRAEKKISKHGRLYQPQNVSS